MNTFRSWSRRAYLLHGYLIAMMALLPMPPSYLAIADDEPPPDEQYYDDPPPEEEFWMWDHSESMVTVSLSPMGSAVPGGEVTLQAYVETTSWDVWTSTDGNVMTDNVTTSPYSDAMVRWSKLSGDGNLSWVSDWTDGYGVAEAGFFMGDSPADIAVEIDYFGTIGTEVAYASLTLEPDSTSGSGSFSVQMTVDGGAEEVASGAQRTITVELMGTGGDAGGNAYWFEPGVPITFYIQSGDGGLADPAGGFTSGFTTTTDSSGRAQIEFTMGETETVVSVAHANQPELFLQGGSVTFTPAPPGSGDPPPDGELWEWSHTESSAALFLETEDGVTEVPAGEMKNLRARLEVTTWEVYTSNYGNTDYREENTQPAAWVPLNFAIQFGDGWVEESATTAGDGTALVSFQMGAGDTTVHTSVFDGDGNLLEATLELNAAAAELWKMRDEGTVSLSLTTDGSLTDVPQRSQQLVTAHVRYRSWEVWGDGNGVEVSRNFLESAAQGAEVNFAVDMGDGSVNNSTVTTDSAGQATVTFTMGSHESQLRGDAWFFGTISTAATLDFTPPGDGTDGWVKTGSDSMLDVNLMSSGSWVTAQVSLVTWDVYALPSDPGFTESRNTTSSPAIGAQVEFSVNSGTCTLGSPMVWANENGDAKTRYGASEWAEIRATASFDGHYAEGAVSVDPNPPIIVTNALPPGIVGHDYAAAITAAGGVGPYTFDLHHTQHIGGGLPNGYGLSQSGVIVGVGDTSGTGVQQPGTYSFNVMVTDSMGLTGEKELSLELTPIPQEPLTITTQALPVAVVGNPYHAAIGVSGANGYTAFSASGLPPGMTLDDSGLLSGPAPAEGSYQFSVSVLETNGIDNQRSASATLTLVVADPELTIVSGNEQVVFGGEDFEPLVVRLTVAGEPLAGAQITFGGVSMTTDSSGLARWTGSAPYLPGLLTLQVDSASSSVWFTLGSAGQQPGSSSTPTISTTSVVGSPSTPSTIVVADAEAEVQSRWVSVQRGSLEASYSGGAAYGIVNGVWRTYREEGGPPPYSASGTRWRASNDPQEHESEPPSPGDLGANAWAAGASSASYFKYPDTESGPVEGPELGSGSPKWPEWVNHAPATTTYGAWYGRSRNRSGKTEAEVRLKRVGESTEAISRTFIAVIEEDGVLKSAEPVTLEIAENTDESPPYLLSVSTTETGVSVTKRLLPIHLDVLPGEEVIVPADIHAIDLMAEVFIDPQETAGTAFADYEIMEAEIGWSVTRGNGSVSESTSTLDFDEPEAETTLATSTSTGDELEVQATLKSITIGDEDAPEEWQTFQLGNVIKQNSGTITVGPGEAGNIEFAVTAATGGGNGASMPADGQSTREITVTVTDGLGNNVAAGVPVAWRLKGDGWFLDQFADYQRQTDANGQAHATLRAGRIPGLAQTVIVETDFKREEFVIANTPLNFTLAAGAVATETVETVPVKKTFTVSANVTAADGAPIRWRTSKGRITSSSSTVQGGTASATVEVTETGEGTPQDGFNGLAVVTAAVSKSTAIASVNLGGIDIRPQTPAIQPGGNPVPVQVHAPELAGQTVRITPAVSFQQQVQAFDAPALQAASGVLASAPHAGNSLTYGSLRADVVVQQPAVGATAGTLLEEPGVYSLELNSSNQPVLKVQTSAGEDSVTLTQAPAAIAPGEAKTITLSLTSTTATVSVGGYSAATPLRGPPLPGTTTARVPAASLPRVSAITFLWQQPAAGGVLQLTGLTNDTLILDAAGNGVFQAALPAGFTGTTARLMVAAANENSTVPPAQHALPAGQNDVTGPNVPEVWQDAMDLHTNVHFENRTGGSATEAEQTELARYAAHAAVNAQKAVYQSGLDKLAPLEHGGALPHQAQQGKKYLEMAAKLDAAAAEIEKMVAATSAVTVTDESGKQLFSMDIADFVQRQVADAGQAAWAFLSPKLKPLADTVKNVTADSLGALVESVKSTETWRHAQIIAQKMDNIPLLGDAKILVQNLTDEGLVEYLKAMWRFSKVAATNPQAAAMYGFTQLEDVIKGPLNDWARANGEGAQVAAAAAGLAAYVAQTGAVLAGTSMDTGAVRRMVSQMLGTVLSAALGNQQAQDELKEMVPFYSWLMMGEQIADLWTGKDENGGNATDDGLPDYYGAGKKAAELIVQVIGDVTIIFPVVKGASVAIKAGNKASTVLLQALKKTTTGFVRETADNFTGGLAGGVKRAVTGCRVKGLCFAPGTRVLMADGSAKPIETIQPGDIVLSSESGNDAAPIAAEVSQIQQGYTQSLVHVRIDTDGNGNADGTVKATKNHPFWVVGAGWTDAVLLEAGDRLVQPGGGEAIVIEAAVHERASETWDLTVAGTHNFYVLCGDGAVRVHNLDKTQYRAFVVYRIPEVGTDRFYIGKASMPITAGQKVRPGDILEYRYSGEDQKQRVEKRQGVKLDFTKAEFPAKIFLANPTGVGDLHEQVDMISDVVSQMEHNLIQTQKAEGKAVNINRGINPKNQSRVNRIQTHFNQFKSKFSLESLRAMGIDC